MIAYNRRLLDEYDILDQASAAKSKGLISEEEFKNVQTAYPYRFYTPNYFARGGFFLLTVIICLAVTGMFFLMGVNSEGGAIFIMIMMSLACFGILEWIIYERKVYRAGTDDALAWMGAAFMLIGLGLMSNRLSMSVVLLETFIVTSLCVGRYADAILALVGYTSLLGFILDKMVGSFEPAYYAPVFATTFIPRMAPFAIMLVSILGYSLFTGMRNSQTFRHYHSCMTVLRAATLLSLYLAGNVFIAREVEGSSGLGFIWLSWTAVVPVVYIVIGIRKKDPVFLWLGLAIVAASVFTVRYYYHVLPTETAMILAGSIMVLGSWWLIKYLRVPRHGFTSEAPAEPHILEHIPVETVILAETFNPANQATGAPNRLAGGSGGGGGAGGEF